jgi:aldehyde:ferredoxin oxidoreductase
MMREFNRREGFGAKDDILPERLFEDGLVNEGRGKGRKIDRKNFFARRADYYALNGWDPETGNPTEVKLRELGLGWLI